MAKYSQKYLAVCPFSYFELWHQSILSRVNLLSYATSLQIHGILGGEQHGFQTGKSCDSQLIIAINYFANCLNENIQLDAIFFDFSKAFDKVPHQRLFNKLSYYGIRGSMLTWIQNYLTNIYQNVILERICSNNSLVTFGVPQGTVLAALLFLCFVNGILTSVQCKIKLRCICQ